MKTIVITKEHLLDNRKIRRLAKRWKGEKVEYNFALNTFYFRVPENREYHMRRSYEAALKNK